MKNWTWMAGSRLPGMTRRSRQRVIMDSQMREVVRQRDDLFLAERIGDFRHRCHAAAGADAGFIIPQGLEQIVLALACDARHRLGAGITVEMTRRAAAAGCR